MTRVGARVRRLGASLSGVLQAGCSLECVKRMHLLLPLLHRRRLPASVAPGQPGPRWGRAPEMLLAAAAAGTVAAGRKKKLTLKGLPEPPPW